jgi:hypothetical protein
MKIQHKKQLFVRTFNRQTIPQNQFDRSIEAGIAAAVGRNRLYKRGLSSPGRLVVRNAWSGYLAALATKYKSAQSESAYESDITVLKDSMNRNYQNCFSTNSDATQGYDPGFRVSHAQKSISVMLKHLWCLGFIPEPPQCPVDRIILTFANAPYAIRKWGCVNTLDEHQKRIRHLKSCSKPCALSLAEWELLSF